VLKLLNRLDAFRRPERIESFVLTCEADSRGRGNASKGPYVPAQLLNDYFNAARKIDLSDLADSNLDGTARRNEVERRRTEAISSVRANRTKAD
jgi:tRNA nucleotidyltransferase (CCA-adding enzyme)